MVGLSVGAAFVSGVAAAPIPITGETVRTAEAERPAPAPAANSAYQHASTPADIFSARSSDSSLIAEMGEGGIVALRTPAAYAGANTRGQSLGYGDAFQTGSPFRTNFFSHWDAERGGNNQLRRFGRSVDPIVLGGFGFFGDAIYAAHNRFKPFSESGPDNNGMTGWFVGGWTELVDLVGMFERIGDGAFDHDAGDRFGAPETGDRVVVIPLPGSAAMAGVGLLLLASRRRR